MVTIITDRLKKQSLDDTIFPDLISSNLKPAQNSCFLGVKGHGVLYNTRRLRSRTFDTKGKAKCDTNEIDSRNLGNSSNSFGGFPPSCKKICRSTPELIRADQPPELIVTRVKWKPEPSSIWMPKGKNRRNSRTLKVEVSSGCAECRKSQEKTQSGAISTPPDSPTPRPASANSIYDNTKWSEQSYHRTHVNSNQTNRISFRTRLSRSRSHPCVTTRQNKRGGIKRPFSEERPALDLDKMEETAYRRELFQLKDIQMPISQNHPSKDNTSDNSEQSSFMLKPIIGSPVHTPLDVPSSLENSSSVMITPNSSPIKELINIDSIDTETRLSKIDEQSNKKTESLEVICTPDEGIFELDSDLDIDSIEGDY